MVEAFDGGVVEDMRDIELKDTEKLELLLASSPPLQKEELSLEEIFFIVNMLGGRQEDVQVMYEYKHDVDESEVVDYDKMKKEVEKPKCPHNNIHVTSSNETYGSPILESSAIEEAVDVDLASEVEEITMEGIDEINDEVSLCVPIEVVA
ncbi:hypothetical protein Tco_1164081 [Tanacetum coccineum]